MADTKIDPLTGLDMAINKLEETVSGVDKNTDALLLKQGQSDAASDAARKATERQKFAQAGFSGSRAVGLQQESQRDMETARQEGLSKVNLGFMDRQDKATQDLASLSIKKDQIIKQDKQVEKSDFDAAVSAVDWNDASAVSALEQRGKALYGQSYSLAGKKDEFKTKKFGDNKVQWDFFLAKADLKTAEGRKAAASEWTRLFGSTQLMPDFEELGRQQTLVVDKAKLDEWDRYIKDAIIAGNEDKIAEEWKRLFPNKPMPSLEQIKLDQKNKLTKDNRDTWDFVLKGADLTTDAGMKAVLDKWKQLFPNDPIPNLEQLKADQLVAKTKTDKAINDVAVKDFENSLSTVIWGDLTKNADGSFTGLDKAKEDEIRAKWIKAYPGQIFPGVDGLIALDRKNNSEKYINEYNNFLKGVDLTTAKGREDAIRLHKKAYGTEPTGLDDMAKAQWVAKEADAAKQFGTLVGKKIVDGELKFNEIFKDGKFTDKLDVAGQKLMTDWYGAYSKGGSPFKVGADGKPTNELTDDAKRAFDLQFSKLGQSLADETFNAAKAALDANKGSMSDAEYKAALKVLEENRLTMIIGQKLTVTKDPLTGKEVIKDSTGKVITPPTVDVVGTKVDLNKITVGEGGEKFELTKAQNGNLVTWIKGNTSFALNSNGDIVTITRGKNGSIIQTPYAGADKDAIKKAIQKNVSDTATNDKIVQDKKIVDWKGTPTVKDGLTTYNGTAGFYGIGDKTYMPGPNGIQMRMGVALEKDSQFMPTGKDFKLGEQRKLPNGDYIVYNGTDWLHADATDPFEDITKDEDILAIVNAGKISSGFTGLWGKGNDWTTLNGKSVVKNKDGKYSIGKFPSDDKVAEKNYLLSNRAVNGASSTNAMMEQYGKGTPIEAFIAYFNDKSNNMSAEELAYIEQNSDMEVKGAYKQMIGNDGWIWKNYHTLIGAHFENEGLVVGYDDTSTAGKIIMKTLKNGKLSTYTVNQP